MRRTPSSSFQVRLAVAVFTSVMLQLGANAAAQDKPPATTQAAQPRRTEADARARAEANRRDREQQRLKSGAPVELISDYVKANIGPVPESLGVNPFYKKYTDAF